MTTDERNPSSEGQPDEDLACESQGGSLTAFEELVYRYENRVFAFVTHCCGNFTDAREITQDTFVRAFQSIAQFNPARTFAPWLFAIARRKCLDYHRKAQFVAEGNVPELPDDNDPSELLAREEERRDLWRLARKCLPAAQFQALWLRYAEDMDVAQTAQALNKTKTHVKVLLFRARQTLAGQLRAATADRSSRGNEAPSVLRPPGNKLSSLLTSAATERIRI
jgi:RNA polymerase sigma-70 factor (ECF subfamily)